MPHTKFVSILYIMNKTITTFSLALLASAFTVFAQQPPAPVAPEGKRPRPPLISALDANGDKVIDAQEIANAPAALKTLDKNGDGKLTHDELRPERPDRPNAPAGGKGGKREKTGGQGGEKPRQPVVAALDANNDKVIDEQEIANAPAALKTLDKNNDGKLTRDEFHPKRPDGEQQPGMKDNGPRKHRNHQEATPAATPVPAT